MATQKKRGLSNFKLPAFNKRERQVTPVEDPSRAVTPGNKNARIKDDPAMLKTVSKQVDNKRIDREDKRLRKEEGERMKVVDEDNRRMKRRKFRKDVRKDLSEASLETCATFCFIFVVGSTLFGGGAALIVTGRENNVFDFIVVGSAGLVIGAIFTAAGVFLLIKPVYEKYLEQKDNAEIGGFESLPNDESKPKDPTLPYVDEARKKQLTFQIADARVQGRSPSNTELYGEERETSFDKYSSSPSPREESFHSYTHPPCLAVPNNERESCQTNPVMLFDAKEATSPKKHATIHQRNARTNPDAELLIGFDLKSDEMKTNNKSENSSSLQNSNNVSKGDNLPKSKKKARADRLAEIDISKGTESFPKADTKVKSNSRPKENNTRSSNETIGQSLSNESTHQGVGIAHLLKHASKNTVIIEHSVLDLDSAPTTSVQKHKSKSHPEERSEPQAVSVPPPTPTFGLKDIVVDKLPPLRKNSPDTVTVPLHDLSSDSDYYTPR